MFNDRGIPYDPLHHKVLFPCHGHLFLSDSDQKSVTDPPYISMDACTVMKREKRHNASGISNEGMQFLAMLCFSAPTPIGLCILNLIIRPGSTFQASGRSPGLTSGHRPVPGLTFGNPASWDGRYNNHRHFVEWHYI